MDASGDDRITTESFLDILGMMALGGRISEPSTFSTAPHARLRKLVASIARNLLEEDSWKAQLLQACVKGLSDEALSAVEDIVRCREDMPSLSLLVQAAGRLSLLQTLQRKAESRDESAVITVPSIVCGSTGGGPSQSDIGSWLGWHKSKHIVCRLASVLKQWSPQQKEEEITTAFLLRMRFMALISSAFDSLLAYNDILENFLQEGCGKGWLLSYILEVIRSEPACSSVTFHSMGKRTSSIDFRLDN